MQDMSILKRKLDYTRGQLNGTEAALFKFTEQRLALVNQIYILEQIIKENAIELQNQKKGKGEDVKTGNNSTTS